MLRFRTFAALGALVLAGVVSAAVAQERASPPRPGAGNQAPPGSYQRTCRGIDLNGNILRAQCPGPTGAPITSSIDVNSCRGRDIANDRGYLRCSRGAGPQPPRPQPPGPRPPEPPPHQAVQAIAYTQTNFRGRKLVISGPMPNLANHRGFNDSIRSIQIVRGRPTVCADRLYRGRCVTLNRSYRDLNTVGMANAISSIR